MLEIKFHTVTVTVNAVDFTVSRHSIAHSMFNVDAIRPASNVVKRTPEDVIFDLATRGIISQIMRGDPDNYAYSSRRWQIVHSVSEALACDTNVAETIIRTLQNAIVRLHIPTEDLIAGGAYFDALIDDYIVMYLPTYRRIEKDIRFLFGEASARAASSVASTNRTKPEFFVELVDFGMNDVGRMLSDVEEKLRLEALGTVWGLSGEYLVNVVSGEAANKDVTGSINNLSPERLTAIVERSRRHLPFHPYLTENIMNTVSRLRADEPTGVNDYYVAHYVKLLIDADRKIRQTERPARHFVTACNRYLVDKHIEFASDTSAFKIRADMNFSDNDVELHHLSSGEKQIVSLFAHLAFGERPVLLFIDEPELSLSIDWQQRFLPDIWQTRRCRFLFASTHSPFLYENFFEDSAIDLLAQRVAVQ